MIAGGDHTIIQRLSARFPLWGNNVGAKRRQCNTNIFPLKFRGTMSKHGIFATLLHYRANTVLLKNLPRWRADTIRPYMAYPLKLHSYNKIFAAVIRWHHPYMARKNRPPWAVLQKGKEVTCRSAWYKTELFRKLANSVIRSRCIQSNTEVRECKIGIINNPDRSIGFANRPGPQRGKIAAGLWGKYAVGGKMLF